MADDDTPARGWTPVPDPTELTTKNLQREIAALKELIEARIVSLDHTISTRLEGHETLQKVQFEHIADKFIDRDAHADKANRDSKDNIAAALQAAKESVFQHNQASSIAIAKSETAMNKTIDQIMTLIHTSNDSLESKISDIKDRLTSIEGKGAGVAATQSKQEKDSSFWVSVVAVLVAFSSLIVMVFINVTKGG